MVECTCREENGLGLKKLTKLDVVTKILSVLSMEKYDHSITVLH
jgi:hypothetical protein